MSLNSALKQARELDATKSYAGALFQYLYAVGYYGMLDAAPLDSSQKSALKSALAMARQKLDASPRDESIEQLFVEKAESQVAHLDGSAPSADDWRIAKVVVDQVLPAYFAIDKPFTVQERASGKTIDITLVRWPYTWSLSDPASLLVQEITSQYPRKVTFVSENFGTSKLAERFGVKGYPAVFVDDVLVACPRDFGYFREVEGLGRYAPWQNADNQAKFKTDLSHMIDLILAGRKNLVLSANADSSASLKEIAALPKFKLTDLSGHPLEAEQVSGRVVLVEFWATWCPPCRSTLDWLGELKRKYGDKVAILALAVESPEDQIHSVANSLSPDLRVAVTDAAAAEAFGNITSVPTLFLFDRSGKTAQVIYGAPPNLHQQVSQALESLAD